MKEKNAVATKRDYLQNVSNKHEDANYRKSDINKNQNVDETDANKNISCENRKSSFPDTEKTFYYISRTYM